VNVRVRMIAGSEPIHLPRKAPVGVQCAGAILKRKPVMFDDQWMEASVFDRSRLLPGNELAGPAIVHEYSATTVLPPGCKARVDEYSNLVIEV